MTFHTDVELGALFASTPSTDTTPLFEAVAHATRDEHPRPVLAALADPSDGVDDEVEWILVERPEPGSTRLGLASQAP